MTLRGVLAVGLSAWFLIALDGPRAGDMEGNYLDAGPMLGRPTDKSVTISILPAGPGEVYVNYGETAGDLRATTPTRTTLPHQPVELVLSGLRPDNAYYYSVMCRPQGASEFHQATDGKFHTQRARGASFVFTVQADVHLNATRAEKREGRALLYERTLNNVLADAPDFHIDMGDLAQIEVVGGRSAKSLADAADRYFSQRRFLSIISPSIPFYMVLGNHEAEQGWRLTSPVDSLAIWAMRARKSLIPNPFPDGFYSGNADTTGYGGLKEDYYAWEWGDALFVVLDPFLYTIRRPHNVVGVSMPSLNGWDWTLGEKQYNWLYETLHQSRAKWKFVFSHHMTGGVLGDIPSEGYYGRGGIDAARYSVAHRPSFEWGGEDSLGNYAFEAHRPGWKHGPIHQMMADNGVDIFFRGHDHIFVYERLDSIVYQTCPDAADFHYGTGYYNPRFFTTGTKVNNSGHLRVTVSRDSVRVDYVRAVLPQDEPLNEGVKRVRNGDISYSYTVTKRPPGAR